MTQLFVYWFASPACFHWSLLIFFLKKQLKKTEYCCLPTGRIAMGSLLKLQDKCFDDNNNRCWVFVLCDTQHRSVCEYVTVTRKGR